MKLDRNENLACDCFLISIVGVDVCFWSAVNWSVLVEGTGTF